MVRTQIQLSEEQHRGLKALAHRRGVSLAAVIRELVEAYEFRQADLVEKHLLDDFQAWRQILEGRFKRRADDPTLMSESTDEARDRLGQWADICDEALFYAPTVGVPPERVRDNLDAILDVFGRNREK